MRIVRLVRTFFQNKSHLNSSNPVCSPRLPRKQSTSYIVKKQVDPLIAGNPLVMEGLLPELF
jgi:hypothetical protein